MTNRHDDSNGFDLDEWLESVEGETVLITAPQPGDLGPGAARLLTSRTEYTVTWCNDCDGFRLLVATDPDEVCGHCPVCGRPPGALELGTKEAA